MVVNKVDVICEHKSDGAIIPLRFQIVDEDGVYQRFTVKGYKLMKNHGAFNTVDGLYIANDTDVYECRIEVLGVRKDVRLYCSKRGAEWKLGF